MSDTKEWFDLVDADGTVIGAAPPQLQLRRTMTKAAFLVVFVSGLSAFAQDELSHAQAALLLDKLNTGKVAASEEQYQGIQKQLIRISSATPKPLNELQLNNLITVAQMRAKDQTGRLLTQMGMAEDLLCVAAVNHAYASKRESRTPLPELMALYVHAVKTFHDKSPEADDAKIQGHATKGVIMLLRNLGRDGK